MPSVLGAYFHGLVSHLLVMHSVVWLYLSLRNMLLIPSVAAVSRIVLNITICDCR